MVMRGPGIDSQDYHGRRNQGTDYCGVLITTVLKSCIAQSRHVTGDVTVRIIIGLFGFMGSPGIMGLSAKF